MHGKIAILIIVLAGNVSCIRNANGNDQHISVKLKNFFPSEPLSESEGTQEPPQISARVTSSSGFRPSQMLDFTPSDVMSSDGLNRYPPSYLAPNYQHQFPSSQSQSQSQSPVSHQAAMDKQFSFPEEPSGGFHSLGSTTIPTTPVVSYLDPYTQQNYGYVPTATPPTLIQYQREQPEDDQAYTVQSTLLVGSHQQHQQPQRPRPGYVDDVYLKRPGYVFDESPSSAVYRRPTKAPPALPAPPTTASHKISYDSHDYPPPSYAAEQTSNFVPQTLPERPLYNRQDINDNRPAVQETHRPRPQAQAQLQIQHQPQPKPQSRPPSSSNYANNFDNYLQRPPPSYQSHSQSQSHAYTQPQPQLQAQSQPQLGSSPTHYQYEPLARPQPGVGYGQGQGQGPRPGHNYYEYQIGEIPPPQSHPGQRPSQYPSQYPSQHQHQQQQQFSNYRPGAGPTTYRPSQSSSSSSGGGGVGGGGGLATLASLFSSTQQYAPQFTNLLLGTASSTQSQSSPLGSLLGAFAGNGYQQHQQQQQQYQKPQQGRPPNTQLIRALENIARNDDLECVPKVLCQMIAGQTLRGQLPGFITSPAIANFLTGFPVASPALIYGRAALLGLSGGERSCLQSYEKCPKNEMEIIHYLNNHRGGFFKFFSEPEEQPVAAQQSESGAGSLFSILSALTGGGGGGGQSQVYTTPRPVARPTQRPSTDIASGIGSFFSQVLSEYLNGVEYQRRRRRRRRSLLPTEIKRAIQTDDARLMPVDFHDEEDGLDTQSGRVVKFQDDDEAEAAQAHTELIGVLQFPEDEGRVLNFKGIESEEYHQDGAIRFPDATPAEAARDDQSKIIREFNRDAAQRKLRFPPEGEDDGAVRQAKHLALIEGWRAVLPNGLAEADFGVDKRRGKRIVFKDTNEELDEQAANEERYREEQLREVELREEQLREERIREDELRVERIREIQLREQNLRDEPQHYPLNAVYEEAAPPQRGARVIFPDHYERYIRKGKILNRPTYAPSYEYGDRREEKEDRLVLSNEHRPGAHYRLEAGDYQSPQSPSTLNYGEYMPSSTVRFGEPTERPSPQYNYPNANYISDNRYGSRPSQKPRYEDDKNIYVTNSQGVNEYYIRPDGSKVYLRAG
ncbi:uncharacterized protein LOC6598943 [Drosophila persimilis]|uniref:uncharacterized protein LOC6598943 n=1 Tax=Drosophila persimilis TaxID=7234 RepID=UPI000F09273A|nr:uncharacterized protein LOC6598943 [Drosophila persimilis]